MKNFFLQKNLIENAMSISGATFPNELEFLYEMAMKAPEHSQFVELGTYQGRTLMVLIPAAIQRNSFVTSIDNYSYEENCSLEIVRDNLLSQRMLTQIELIEGDSRTRPEHLDNIGLLFVDSQHTKAQFDVEMAAWLGSVQKNGIVVCHDYDSPRWLEMTAAINGWLRNKNYQYLGMERRMIAFQKLF